MELSLIARLPSKLRLFIPDGRPFVAEIIVIEMKELKKGEGVSGALQK